MSANAIFSVGSATNVFPRSKRKQGAGPASGDKRQMLAVVRAWMFKPVAMSDMPSLVWRH
jgi:ABC-type branched-subunit amino acid transport system ATPase component